MNESTVTVYCEQDCIYSIDGKCTKDAIAIDTDGCCADQEVS